MTIDSPPVRFLETVELQSRLHPPSNKNRAAGQDMDSRHCRILRLVSIARIGWDDSCMAE